MGSVVGNKEPNGRLQGVAPGAQLVSLFYGVSNAHGLIEGLIAAFRHPKVDIIVLEQSVAIASIPYLLADATHPISVIAQRLTDRYKKLMFVPGDNSPAFGYVAEDGLAPGAMSVGGYQSKESYRVNNGLIPEHDDNLHWGALSHGPERQRRPQARHPRPERTDGHRGRLPKRRGTEGSLLSCRPATPSTAAPRPRRRWRRARRHSW